MLFKQKILALRSIGIVILLLTLTQCIEEDEGDATQAPLTLESVEDVERLIAGITFVGTLPDGSELNFTPSSTFTELGNITFQGSEGIAFSTPPTGIVIDGAQFSEGGGELVLDGVTHEFLFALCITLGEIETLFPGEIFITSDMRDWVLVTAIGNEGYSVHDAVFSVPFTVDDYLSIVFDPASVFIESGFFAPVSGPFWSLDGEYMFEDNKLNCSGSAFDGFSFVALYSAFVDCGE